ncbi:MAG: HAMP domain-containing histidine kinase [Pirellulaceae bacterium]|nr:HAMP domain-containing histidine kinase [Pirellulaceae bacterium]
MLSRWPIRYKMSVGATLLLVIVGSLSFVGFRGVYAYRTLARSISRRAMELPQAEELTRSVDELRYTARRLRSRPDLPLSSGFDPVGLREEFRLHLVAVKDALRRYREQLDHPEMADDPLIGDDRDERETVREIQRLLTRISELNSNEDWVLNEVRVDLLEEHLDQLNQLSGELPLHLQRRMHAFAGQVRGQYRAWIVLTWAASILCVSMLATLGYFFYIWVFRPLRVLIEGSRRVAAGDFDHRIHLNTHDEVAELAGAMNAMTSRFQEIRDGLNREVQQRTKEVLRSDQLASVGFLAAGVAHEINNPLASIAWCAESLESRVQDIIQQDDCKPNEEQNAEIGVLRNYLRKIQDEAFRCKGITEKLLDFSRMGDSEKHPTDLRELVEGVIEMVRHLGSYRQKQIEFSCRQRVVAAVNPQETKQVVLNLITNALDSLDAGGVVQVRLSEQRGEATLEVRDNGCGMTEEVLEHLFEPFFTRRRDGKGTGLGLSISYRIVAEHGGRIEASSDGPGRGSQFRVRLPLGSLRAAA